MRSPLDFYEWLPWRLNSSAFVCAEIEITGSHTQFYDKFNTRFYITQLFKLVWSNPTHREALKRESQ